MRSIIILLFSAAAAFSQPFSAGVKLGVPMTDFISTVQSGTFNANSTTNRYIVGVTAELHLPLGLSIEGDVLYRHFNYTSFSSLVDGNITSSATSNAWEFPLLVKYKFPSKIVRPYVEGGVAWDTLQGLKDSITTNLISTHTSVSTSSPGELKNSTTMGIVLGAGVEVKALVIKISPEIRYTRWTDQHFNAANLLQSNQNQAEFLVGITF
jgi:hypothetical protein